MLLHSEAASTGCTLACALTFCSPPSHVVLVNNGTTPKRPRIRGRPASRPSPRPRPVRSVELLQRSPSKHVLNGATPKRQRSVAGPRAARARARGRYAASSFSSALSRHPAQGAPPSSSSCPTTKSTSRSAPFCWKGCPALLHVPVLTFQRVCAGG